jgi:hypothetical protein
VVGRPGSRACRRRRAANHRYVGLAATEDEAASLARGEATATTLPEYEARVLSIAASLNGDPVVSRGVRWERPS